MTDEKIDKLAAALSAAQGQIHNAAKNKQGYGYQYADLAQILDIIRPVLSENGLSICQLPVKSDTQGYMGLRTTIAHTSGQRISEVCEMPIEKSKNLSMAQAAGAVITYMRRYSLASLMLIAQDDPDAAVSNAIGHVQHTFDGAKIKAQSVHGVDEAQEKDRIKKQIIKAAKILFETENPSTELKGFIIDNKLPADPDKRTVDDWRMILGLIEGEMGERQAMAQVDTDGV